MARFLSCFGFPLAILAVFCGGDYILHNNIDLSQNFSVSYGALMANLFKEYW